MRTHLIDIIQGIEGPLPDIGPSIILYWRREAQCYRLHRDTVVINFYIHALIKDMIFISIC
jgi:hypothetical protein